jgi:superfamily II DNA helicase RecQ
MSGIRASFVNVKESTRRRTSQSEDDDAEVDDAEVETLNIDIDFCLCEQNKLRDGYYHIIFAHPESLILASCGRELLLSERYQEKVVGIVIDEAHCM